MGNITLTCHGDTLFEGSGAFISHSSKDGTYEKVTAWFRRNGIGFVGDSQIPAGTDFHHILRGMIRSCSGGIILLSEDAFSSPWIMYEIGMLEGLGKDITLFYDGEQDIKSMMPEMLRRYHIEHDLYALGELVRKYSIFGRLFEHETLDFKAADFREAIAGTVETLRLSVALSGLGQIDPDHFRFGCIVLRLARCGRALSDYKKCAVTNEKRTGTLCTMNEDSGVSCGFLEEVMVKDAPETVILNSILYETTVACDMLELSIPVHKRYGVTLKCFVDVKDKSVKSTLEKLLRGAGMEDVSYSESGESQRIYFLLPQSHKNGLFHIVSPEGIINNYICPSATAE